MALTAKKVYAILKRQISDMEAKLNSPVRYRGTVATADLLPLNPDIGDMYNIESKSVYGEAGMNVAWNGVVWDTMGAPIDMSLYIKSNELAEWAKQQNKPTYTAEEVGALPADTKIPSKTSDLQNDSGFLTEIPDNYLSGTDKTLSVSGKAADAKVTGEKIAKNSSDITKKLDKNQGVENSGKIAGINESGDIVPMFPVGVEYNSETNCLEFGSDQKMELNQGIGLDSTLTKIGYAADAGTVGEITNSLKEELVKYTNKYGDYISEISENTKNLLDKTAITKGFLSDDGTISTSDTSLWTSDFIDVDNTDFTLSWGISPLEPVIRVGFFNESKTFINRTVENVSPSMRNLSFTNKYKYIRVSTKYGMENLFQVELGKNASNFETYLTAKDNVAREMLTNKNYDVCIIGGGASGVACAYALKNSGLKVALIEKEHYLGGTHTMGYVSSLVSAPAPLFLKDVTYDQIKKGQAIISRGEHNPLSVDESLNLNWNKTYYHNPDSYCCVFNPISLAIKYYGDLSDSIDIFLDTEINSATYNVGFVTSVSDGKSVWNAKKFVDSTANDILLSLIGVERYYGGDANNRYLKDYGFTEPNGATTNYDFCNATTLLYRITKAREDLSNITAKYYDNVAYWFYNADPNRIYLNSINHVSGKDSGINVINNGIKAEYDRLKDEMIKQWKTVKLGMLYQTGMLPHPSTDYKFDGVAPMLGVRESYRAKCERMLGEEAMYTKISRENIKDKASNLDKIIAVGGYIADLFNDPQISTTALEDINGKIKEFGVPYGCIIPKGWNNLFVASRGAGFTHITASSFRLTRHMMQLGWVAGCACKLAFDEEIVDFKQINVEQLQSPEYANINGLVDVVLSL